MWEWLTKLDPEWEVIRRAPFHFIVAVIIGGIIAFVTLSFFYEREIAILNASIEALRIQADTLIEQADLLQSQFDVASEQARRSIDQYEELRKILEESEAREKQLSDELTAARDEILLLRGAESQETSR